MKCEKCGSENIIEGGLYSQGNFGTVLFAVKKNTKKLFSKFLSITANACKDCGNINIILFNPKEL